MFLQTCGKNYFLVSHKKKDENGAVTRNIYHIINYLWMELD